MDSIETEAFTSAMMSVNPDVYDYCDALTTAIQGIDCVYTEGEDTISVRYFGSIADGTLYLDEKPDRMRWFPDTTPPEAMLLLSMEFGEEFTHGLDPFGDTTETY